MESPSARGGDSAMLLHHLDSMPPGGNLHRRRVSRTPQIQADEVFYTPRNAPQSPRGTLDPNQSPNRPQWSRTASPRVTLGEQDRSTAGGAQSGLQRSTANDSAVTSTPAQLPPELSLLHQLPNSLNSGNRTASPPISQPHNYSSTNQNEGRRRCAACQKEISGHFVRALGAAYHIDCFTCEDCGVQCASKFFPLNNRPLCEHCYFKRQNLLCHRCNGSLRGSYITALDHKYHVEHFTCLLCPTVFGPDDSYFEHEGNVYCRIHYAALFAFRCEGCSSPILKQFVETSRGGKNLRWHPECYMIYKFWSVKVDNSGLEEVETLRKQISNETRESKGQEYAVSYPIIDDYRAKRVQHHEDAVEQLALKIWTCLCGYEEACGDQISGLVQSAVNGDFRKAYACCTRFVAYIDVLFRAIDILPPVDEHNEMTGSGKEAKTLCRKVVSYMSLLSKTRQLSSRDRVAGLAKDLLSLASAMAHYLKVLIRYGLAGALKTQNTSSADELSPGASTENASGLLMRFLDAVSSYSTTEPAKPVSPFSSDRCATCGKSVEDRCCRQKARSDRLWHATPECFCCSKCLEPLDLEAATISYAGHLFCLKCSDAPKLPFIITTRLEQYVILLHVALARLDLVLSNHKRPQSQQTSQPQRQHQPQVGQNSSSSPALTGQRGKPGLPTSSGASSAASSAPSTLERTSTILNSKRGLTLDDIRRIVATEQAHSAEQKRAEGPSSHSQPLKEPQNHASNDDKPGLKSYPSTSVLPNGEVSPNKDHFFGRLDDEDYLWVQYIAQALFYPIAKDVLRVEFEPLDYDHASGAPNASTKQSSQTQSGASIWERMGKVFTGGSSRISPGNGSGELTDSSGVFGQPLERVAAQHGIDSSLGVPETSGAYTLRIPSFVDDCVGAMRQKDMSVEGVFRKNGNIRRLREFVEKIDKYPDESGLLVDESPIQLAALLKKFLRDLPDPLLTSRLTRMWIAVSRMDSERQAKVVPLMICLLPRINRNVLETLVNFLNWVSGFAQIEEDVGSKMDIANLATVLTPTFVLSNEEASSVLMPGQGEQADDAEAGADAGANNASSGGYKHVTEVVKLLIQEYTLVAQVPRDVLFYLRRMKQLKLSPRRLSLRELNELMKQ